MVKPDIQEFIAEFDIKHNQRRHDVPVLRFIKGNESSGTELLRNEIWDLYLDPNNYSIRHIAAAVDSDKTSVGRHIQKCKKMYDAWVAENGLALHGDPANRLEDVLAGFDEDLADIIEMSKECKDNDDVRGYKDLQTLKLSIIKEKGKFMGIEPPKTVNINLTSAEETRKKMEEMFPTEMGDK